MKTLLILLLAFAGAAQAQVLHPVKWSYASKRLGKTEAVVFIKATIDDGWHIYSVDQKEGGPVPTAFNFSPSKVYTLSGQVTQPHPTTRFEQAFTINVSFFEHE